MNNVLKDINIQYTCPLANSTTHTQISKPLSARSPLDKSASMVQNNNSINGIIEQGKKAWEQSDEFKWRVTEMKGRLIFKYGRKILSERNYLKKLFLITEYYMELKRKTNKTSSFNNLYSISIGEVE